MKPLVEFDLVPEVERTPWRNQHNVLFCNHGLYANKEQKAHVKIIGDWGNAVWICGNCLRPVKRYISSIV